MKEFITIFESKINYFTKGINLFPPASDVTVVAAENKLGIMLSPQYKEFLGTHNGGRIIEFHLFGVQLLHNKRIPSNYDLVHRHSKNVNHKWWPQSWLEIGRDGFGNNFVADLSESSSEGEYPLLFVDHEEIGRERAASLFALSYFDFLDKILSEMINLYTPNAQLKPK